jgi:hypothetical protein
MSALGRGRGPGVPDVDEQRDPDDDAQAGSNPKRVRKQLKNSSSDWDEEDLLPRNEYEQLREDNIVRNHALFVKLGLNMASTAAGKQPSAATRTKKTPSQKAGLNVSNMPASTDTRKNTRRNPDNQLPDYKERNIGDTGGQRRLPATGPAKGPDTPRRPSRSAPAPTGIHKMVSSDSDSDADDSDVLAEGSHGHHGDEGGHPPTRAEKANGDPAELEKQSEACPSPVGGAAGDASARSVGVPTERRVNLKRQPVLPVVNQLVFLARYPRYKDGILVPPGSVTTGSGKARQTPLMLLQSWDTLTQKTPTSWDPLNTGILAKCPVLRNSGRLIVILTMRYLHNVYWRGSSGGVHVANGGKPLSDSNNICGPLQWMHEFTDGSKSIQFFHGLKIAGFPGIVRASPNTDHKDSTVGRDIPGRVVAWEPEHTNLKDAKLSEPMRQYAKVECFFSFHSRDVMGNFFCHDVALVRKMHRLECGSWGTLLASCADSDTKSNPKGAELLLVINVHRILADVVLVRNEEPATIGCSSWWSSIMLPDGITADSSDGTGDGSLLWHLPVLAV